MQYVLHVDPVEQPEDIVELRPIDRGSIVHAVLDRFVGEGGTRARSASGCTTSPTRSARASPTSGLAGRRLLWEREQRIIHDALDAWLDADDEYRRECGLRDARDRAPLRSDRADALATVASLRFRGAVDRVDRAADGRLFVFDYKTG